MSMSIICARVKKCDSGNVELLFELEKSQQVYVTEIIDELITPLIEDGSFVEVFEGNEEEIIYRHLPSKNIEKLYYKIVELNSELLKKGKEIKGVAEKNSIIDQIESIDRLKNVLIEYFIKTYVLHEENEIVIF